MLRRVPIAPFALAVFPVLSLLASNAAQVSFTVIIRPLLISLGFTLILLLFLRLLLRRWDVAALVASFILVMLFSYGHIYAFLEQHPLADLNLGRHRYLMVVYVLIFLVGLWALIIKLKRTSQVLFVLNLLGLALLVVPILQLTLFSLQTSRQQDQVAQAATHLDEPLVPQLEPLPDVYFIVLDSHTRADALLEDYNLDTSAYLDELRLQGFYIAECSRTNYDYTQGSIVAALNMEYLPNLGGYLEELGTDDIWILLKQSRVRRLLEAAGYKTVAFDTGYEWSNLKDADIYLSLGADSYSLQQVTPFEALLIKSTALLILTDSQSQFLRSKFESVNFPFSDHVRLQNFILGQIPLVSSDPAPTFAFVHLLVPHVPFVFAPDGSVVDDPLFYNGKLAWPGDDAHRTLGYANQVEFIDHRLVEIITEILNTSSTPPIIVIMGDHGLLGENRFEILNSYFLPDDAAEALYPSISPVNSFRLIFDKFFGTNFGLIPDVSYDQSDQPVPETSPACLPK